MKIISTFTKEEIDQGISTLNNMLGLIAGITMVSAVASKVGGSVRTFISLIGVTMAIATLTGACMVALGTDITGVVTNNKEMLNNLYLASEKTGEYIWELPNHDSYRKSLKSSYADLKNVGTRWGGAIIAGQFIEEFVEEVPWLHLDIAGPAFKETGSSYHGLGGTGAGTRLLYEFIKNYK